MRADQQRKRLTADITHDLSTPLQVISGYMEMLEDGSVQLTPQRIEIIKTEIEHLRRLVRDLSTLTQVEAGGLDIQLQPIGAGSLLEKVYNSYQPITEQRGVHLVMDVEDGVPFIRVDEGRMLQVLKNLVENALRYTPRGGEFSTASLVNPLAGKVKGVGTGPPRGITNLKPVRTLLTERSASVSRITAKGLTLKICLMFLSAFIKRISPGAQIPVRWDWGWPSAKHW